MSTSVITPDHHVGICRAACENRKQVLKKLKCLASRLDACERRVVAGCADAKPAKPTKPPLITYPQYPRYPEDFPPNFLKPDTTPPWVKPRSKSVELIASDLKVGCQCTKRNGLQDDCERLQCRGQPQCLTKPDPTCPPSGAWKKLATPEEAKKIIDLGNRKPSECQIPPYSKEALNLLKKHRTCHSGRTVEKKTAEGGFRQHEHCRTLTIPVDIVLHINKNEQGC